jgi:hypothetical protein
MEESYHLLGVGSCASPDLPTHQNSEKNQRIHKKWTSSEPRSRWKTFFGIDVNLDVAFLGIGAKNL